MACGLLFWLVGSQVGRELFPQVDAGQFVIRFRALPGSEYEFTRKLAVKMLEVIDEETRAQVAISMGYVGLAATNTATNNMLLFMRGPDDGQMRCGSRKARACGSPTSATACGPCCPSRLKPWTKAELQRNGLPAEEAQALAEKISFGFEPGDIVSEVMSFGSPTPVEVMVVGPDLDGGPQARAEGARRDEEHFQPPRRATLPTARLPDGPRGDRPREGGLERRLRQGRYRRVPGGHFLQPLRGQELLARPAARGSTTRCKSRSPSSA